MKKNIIHVMNDELEIMSIMFKYADQCDLVIQVLCLPIKYETSKFHELCKNQV